MRTDTNTANFSLDVIRNVRIHSRCLHDDIKSKQWI